jgi:hypothetical protein
LGIWNHQAASGHVDIIARDARIWLIEDSKRAGKSTFSPRPKVVVTLASLLFPASN